MEVDWGANGVAPTVAPPAYPQLLQVLRSHHPDPTANLNSPEKAVQEWMLPSLPSSGQTRLPVLFPLPKSVRLRR